MDSMPVYGYISRHVLRYMERLILAAVLLGTVLAAPSVSTRDDVTPVDFLMPKVQPKEPDTYLCFPMKMKTTPEYIVGFQPHANMAIAHHILLYGCSTPGSNEPVWNCGEMAQKGSGSYKAGPVCGSGSKILYAWAMDAPSLKLPPDVGFKVGGDTGIDYLVLQVHYKDVTSFLPPKNGVDSSGITMEMTTKPQPRRAGVYLIGTGGAIEPHSITYMESACAYNYDFEIHPFAFRTHAHTLGRVTSGYRIRNGQWTEIGRMSPQRPQMFYNSTTPGLIVKKGDILAARCTMENTLDRTVYIGSTQNDEMCNFYVMYFTDKDDTTMSESYCFSAGPPYYYWAKDKLMAGSVDNIPTTASVIPGTSKPLIQTVEPNMYDDYGSKQTGTDDLNDVIGSDMNIDPAQLDPQQLERLLTYLRERGPREDKQDSDYYSY